MRGRLLCDEASEATSYRRGGGGWDVERGRLRRPGEGEQARNEGDHKGQYISKKRASRFVILSAAKDDNPSSASFDSQNVLFEMD